MWPTGICIATCAGLYRARGKRDTTDARISAPEWVKRDGARGLKPRPNAAVYVNKARVVSHTN